MSERLNALSDVMDEWVSQRKRILLAVQNVVEMVEEFDGVLNGMSSTEQFRIDRELEDMHTQRELERQHQLEAI